MTAPRHPRSDLSLSHLVPFCLPEGGPHGQEAGDLRARPESRGWEVAQPGLPRSPPGSRAHPLSSRGSRGAGMSSGRGGALVKVLERAAGGSLPSPFPQSSWNQYLCFLRSTCPGLLGFSVTRQTLPGQTALIQEKTQDP